MGKIRVQDLAQMMGIANQDLVFKLKSIGVRVEGDDAHIDTDVIQAILLGKKLPQPREVILRDREEEQQAPPRPTRRAPARPQPQAPLRSSRRSMIQRVEPRIRTIEVKERIPGMPGDAEPHEIAEERLREPMEVAVSTLEAVMQESGAVEVAVSSLRLSEVQVAELVTVEALTSAPATESEASTVSAVGVAVPAQPGMGMGATEARAAEKPQPTTARPREEAAKPPQKPTPAQQMLSRGLEPRAKIISKPTEPYTTPRPPAPRPPAPRPPAPSAPSERRPPRPVAPPAPVEEEGNRRGARKDDRKRPGGPRPRRDATPERGAPRSAGALRRAVVERDLEDEPTRSVSARGKRRAKRKEEAGRQPGELLSFKEERPQGPVTVSVGITVREFAEKLGVKAKDLIKALVARGVMANINHVLDIEMATQLAAELGVAVMEVSFEEEVQLQHEIDRGGVEGAEKSHRAPVVTVMGHVDHGKTTLLDVIRSANVAAGEAGGITQHIGAYSVDVGGRRIVFLDTPGHEAFTLMRARGAKVTDVVVLVVAADDGVMPQTVEAIDHARAAKVPIVVAINKVDKPNANLDRVKKELADRGLVAEDWGGETVAVPISALKRQGIPELLEMILLTADLLDLKASPEIPAQATVLEARKDIGRGIVATVLVEDGTLHVGDMFVAGSTWGRVRSMSDDHGERLAEAAPSTPVEVTGFNELPAAGDTLQVVEDENRARNIADFRRREDRDRELAPGPQRLSLKQLFTQIEQGETKELAVVVKADVQGSIEVLKETLPKLSTEKVKIRVIHSSAGAISTNDVLLASASQAIIVGFSVRPERNAAALAEKEGVEIRLHTVIYELADELRAAMAGLLEPVYREVEKGRAEVRDIFKVPKVGVIAGSHVVDGVIPRSALVRLVRDKRVVYEGKIASLRRFKEDVSEVRSGFDCGIGLVNFQDLKPGDEIEAYAREEVQPTL